MRGEGGRRESNSHPHPLTPSRGKLPRLLTLFLLFIFNCIAGLYVAWMVTPPWLLDAVGLGFLPDQLRHFEVAAYSWPRPQAIPPSRADASPHGAMMRNVVCRYWALVLPALLTVGAVLVVIGYYGLNLFSTHGLASPAVFQFGACSPWRDIGMRRNAVSMVCCHVLWHGRWDESSGTHVVADPCLHRAEAVRCLSVSCGCGSHVPPRVYHPGQRGARGTAPAVRANRWVLLDVAVQSSDALIAPRQTGSRETAGARSAAVKQLDCRS